MDYVSILSLPSGQLVGVIESTETEITYDLLVADGITRSNPNAVSIAPKLSEDPAADIAAAIAAAASNPVAAFASAAVVEVQAMMDARARQNGYDGILSACTYASPPENTFAAEGNAFLAWRSAVWAACYAALNAHAPSDPIPTMDEFKAGLPAYVPPAS